MMSSTDTLSVLLVDDDPAMLRTTSDVLKLRGYDPVTAESAGRAIELAGHRQPAIAVVDLHLPDMNGLELVAELHEHSRLTQVVVLTGNASVASAAQAVRQSIFDYLVKPISPAQLGDTLERAGERWRRRQAEAALQATEQRYRSLIENAADAILIVDADGIIRYASPAHERVLGYAPSQLVGTRADEILLAEDRQRFHDTLQRLASAIEREATLELRCRRPDGTLKTLSGCGRDLSADPAIGGVVFNLSDVTEQRELEAQLRQAQKMEAVGRLAGGVAHDFNNMLTAIKSYGQLLLEAIEVGDARRADVTEIVHASDRAAALTRQLLAFSRQQVLRPTIVDLNEVVREMEKMLRRLLGTHIQLDTKLAPQLWPVLVDAGQMEQVLLNLVVNARDAISDTGRIAIETADVFLDERYADRHAPAGIAAGHYVMLAVSDTGAGMDAATQARLFEPFFTTKEQDKGTGLGLSTVYGIIKQSGGFIWVYSEVGHGTTFKVYLPRRESPAGTSSVAEGRSTVSTGSERVLLVEDDEMVRVVTRRALERLGYAVTEAANGPEALRLWDREGTAFDLVISDMSMPQMSGVELVRQIKARAPNALILLTSGYTEYAFSNANRFERGVGFIEKPFTPDQLGKRIRDLLDGGAD